MLWNKGYVIEVIEWEIVKQRVTELCSNQQQAETEIFLAAKFVGSPGCNKFSIKKFHSDLAIIAL